MPVRRVIADTNEDTRFVLAIISVKGKVCERILDSWLTQLTKFVRALSVD